MENLKDLKRNKNGFIVMDDFLTGREKVLLSKGFNPCLKIDVDGRDYFIKEEGDINSAFVPKFLKGKSREEFVYNDYFVLSELYLSKLAKVMGINSVDYLPAIVGNIVCVLSNDYNEIADDCKQLNHFLNFRKNMNLKSIHNLTVDWTSNIIPDLEFLALFDLATLQIDRNYTNLAVGKTDNSKIPNSVIAFDYANNGISLFGKNPKKFEKVLAEGGTFVACGTEKFCEKSKIFLQNLTNTEYVSKDAKTRFLTTLDSVLTTGKIEEIHAEVKEESGMLTINDSFKNILTHTLEIMGDKIADACIEQ